MDIMLSFETSLERVNTFLKLIGLSIDNDNHNKTILQRIRKHWIYCIHAVSFNLSVTCEIMWLIRSLFVGCTLWEITYLLPCITLCLLGDLKLYFFIRHMHRVNELVNVLRNLQSEDTESDDEFVAETKTWLTFLSSMSTSLLILFFVGAVAFAIAPFFIAGSYYLSTGEIKLVLPFIAWYPFDELDIRIWPVIYFTQLWGAWVAVFSVYGPDCFFFTCCTFIQIQFMILHRDIERIVKEDAWNRSDITLDTFKTELVKLVNKHRELIRCVNLLEMIYSTSTLFNVLTSSLVICAAGFNLMVIKNLILLTPFTQFLIFGSLQMFIYCYYGDHIMRSSIGVGDAVYNSRWYEAGAAERKYLLIVLLRSQKPCKLTAHGFTDINLTAFTRILSTSWSYFALLKQMYD